MVCGGRAPGVRPDVRTLRSGSVLGGQNSSANAPSVCRSVDFSGYRSSYDDVVESYHAAKAAARDQFTSDKASCDDAYEACKAGVGRTSWRSGRARRRTALAYPPREEPLPMRIVWRS